MKRVAFVLLLAACGGKPTPATCPPPPAVAEPVEAPLPPPDDDLRRWQAIHADGDQPPAGATAASLVPELVAYLASPDPVRRDGIGYEVLAQWIVLAPQLDAAAVRDLATTLVAGLDAGKDTPDGVYGRSFSALVLSLVVARDLADPTVLTDESRRGLLAATRAYAEHETDLRGYTGDKGWAHAAAHTADLLKFLAREPSFTDADRAVILDAVAQLVVRPHGFNFHHGEDGRIAVAVIEAVRRGVAADAIDAWVAAIAAPLMKPPTAAFDPAEYAAQRNARNLLFTLYTQLSFEPQDQDAKASVVHLFGRLRELLGA